MEKIELRINDAPLGYGHLYIVYTNRQGEEFIVRGGPGFRLVLDDIDVEIGRYTPASLDWEPPEERSPENNVVLETGVDLEDKYLRMAFFAQLVEQAEVGYDTLAAANSDSSDLIVNSNTLAAAALASVGIRVTKENLPASEKHRPVAGFENIEAFRAPFVDFLSKTYNVDASQEHIFRPVYEKLQSDYVDRYRGRVAEISNFTHGHGEPDYPRPFLHGVDWRATEKHLRERYKDDPALHDILGKLVMAREIPDAWEVEFLEKYGDDVVFGNSPDGLSVTRGSFKRSLPSGPERQPPRGPQKSGLSEVPDQRVLAETEIADGSVSSEPADVVAASNGMGFGTNHEHVARKTSYDTYKKLGRSPEEEALGIEEYNALLKKGYLNLGGDEEAAQMLAPELFKMNWGLSAFAPDPEGTVIKDPVEKVYPDLEKDGHGYVRREVETFLKSRGLQTKKWYLTPSARTSSDARKGLLDSDGYGPRMTLIVEDETGARSEVTGSFQADTASARRRQLAARWQADREDALRFGIEVPHEPAEASRVKLAMPVPAPEPRRQSAPAGSGGAID